MSRFEHNAFATLKPWVKTFSLYLKTPKSTFFRRKKSRKSIIAQKKHNREKWPKFFKIMTFFAFLWLKIGISIVVALRKVKSVLNYRSFIEFYRENFENLSVTKENLGGKTNFVIEDSILFA